MANELTIYDKLALFHYEERRLARYDPELEQKSGIEKGKLIEFLQSHGFAKKAIDYSAVYNQNRSEVHRIVEEALLGVLGIPGVRAIVKDYSCPEDFTFLVFLKEESREPMTPGHPNILNLLQSAAYDFVGSDPTRCKIFLECCLPERQGMVSERGLSEVINTVIEACNLTKRRCEWDHTRCACKEFRDEPEQRPRKIKFHVAFDLQDYAKESKKQKLRQDYANGSKRAKKE